MNPLHRHILHAALFAASAFSGLHAETQYINLGGPATGYLGVSNFKNSTSQDGIENKVGGNGLADYPNYQIPTGQTNAGVWTAIITATPYAGADYSPFYAYGGVNPEDVTVNNLITTDSNYSTMSAGLIGYNSSLLTGSGIETIGVSDLSFNFDTYEWDGYTANGWNTNAGTVNISPFSTVHTDYNDGGGAGNAAIIYHLSLSNIAGTGLTFQDGQLVSMDIDANLSVYLAVGYAYAPPGSPWSSMFSATFEGEFSASGLNYEFSLDDTRSANIFTDVHMVMNRAGTVSVVPEPSTGLLLGLGAAALAVRRRKR